MDADLKVLEQKVRQRINENRTGVVSRVEMDPNAVVLATDMLTLLSILDKKFGDIAKQLERQEQS